MGRENDIAVSRPQKEFPCWSQGRNMISLTHKSKEKEESILKAKTLGFLVSCLTEACSVYRREGWQLPAKIADREFPKCQPACHRRRQISKVLTPRIMLIVL